MPAERLLNTRQPLAVSKCSRVFPGARPGKPLSDAALAQTVRRLGAGKYTVHGFRSAFRDWAGEHGVEFEVAENCIAHAVGNKVARAYLRTTMVVRRRKVMADRLRFSRANPTRPRSFRSRASGD